MLEIHGKRECPFAWRVRLVAREKGAPFEWVPYDMTSPDARARQHNPERRSPLLWDAGFTLSESMVIAEYIDETCPGRALLPTDPRQRARARQVMGFVRSDIGALREERSSETVVYKMKAAPLSSAALRAASKLTAQATTAVA